jgi:hypothetical protein
MRHGTPTRSGVGGSRYAAGTKIDSHKSRAELGGLLERYGASDFVILEDEANATLRFALYGRYVQYVLPLPELDNPSFTHTPSGRPRAFPAQERAYEQAVRQQWRRAVLVMKGKLEAVESGLSTFEREFNGAIVEEDEKRDRPAALLLRRKLRWAPESLLLALSLGLLIPASGGVALGLPATAVDHVTAPFFGDQPDQFGASDENGSSTGGKALRLSSDDGGGAVVSAPSSGSGPVKLASAPQPSTTGGGGGTTGGSTSTPGRGKGKGGGGNGGGSSTGGGTTTGGGGTTTGGGGGSTGGGSTGGGSTGGTGNADGPQGNAYGYWKNHKDPLDGTGTQSTNGAGNGHKAK